MTSRVAVTGSSGHLGRAVIEKLLLLDDEVGEVVGIDRAPATLSHPKLRHVTADVRDPAIGQHLAGCTALLHFAFVVERGSRDEAAVLAINVGGTRNTVQAALAAGVERIVYSSSIAAYGFHPENADRPLDESSPLRGNADFYYTRTKAETDAWLGEVAAAHPGVAISRLRPSMFIDPASTRGAVVRRTAGVRLIGSGVPAHCTHQEDVVDAFVLAFRKGARGAFNLASEEPLPQSSWPAAMGKRAFMLPGAMRGIELAYQAGWFDVDPRWLKLPATFPIVVSAERARRELGWRPRWPTTGSALRAIAGRPTACASPATRLALGSAALASRLPGGLPLGERRHEARSIEGALNLVLTGPTPSEWHVAFEDGAIRVRPGLRSDARASARMLDQVLHQLLTGKLAWSSAQMTGKVRFHGPGEFTFVPGLLAERFKLMGEARGLAGLPGRAFARAITRRAGLLEARG